MNFSVRPIITFVAINQSELSSGEMTAPFIRERGRSDDNERSRSRFLAARLRNALKRSDEEFSVSGSGVSKQLK